MTEAAIIGLVGVVIGAVLGFIASRIISRNERKAAWAEQLKLRRAQLMTDLTMILESYDLSSDAVTARDDAEDRRNYFERWQGRIEPR